MSHILRTGSQLRKESSSTKVTPFDGDEDLFSRLSFADGTPEADTQKVVGEEEIENQEQGEESGKHENEGDFKTGDELNEAVEFLIVLEDRG